ncbi:MAG: hypothetical protein ACFE95_22200 [Candidatus Hodarchaeota archaeon]
MLMRKAYRYLILLLFLFCFTIGTTPVESGMEGTSPLPSTLFSNEGNLSGGGGASEEEDIDTFDVFPSHRWEITDFGWPYHTIHDGLLNLTGCGSGTIAYYHLSRELQDLDDKIYVRFKVETDYSGIPHTNERFRIYLYSAGVTSDSFIFETRPRAEKNCTTQLSYYDTSNTLQTLNLTGTERVIEGYWYTLEIRYHLLESQLRIKLSFMNGTRVFSYEYYEINSNRPNLFGCTGDLKIRLYGSGLTQSRYFYYYVDWVKAPFESREWYHYNFPSDPQFTSDSWDVAKIFDDITNDRSQWRLVVPYFDTCSGTMNVIQDDDISDFEDDIHYKFSLYGVDGDDGDAHLLGSIEIWMRDTNDPGGNALRTYVIIRDGSNSAEWEHSDEETIYGQTVNFAIGMSDDRSSFSFKAQADLDTTGDTWDWSEIGTYQDNVSTYVTDPSQEFILEVDYDIDKWTGNSEIYFSLSSFDLSEKNIFQGIINAVQGFIAGIIAFFIGIFMLLFRFLAGIFKYVGDLIVQALEGLRPLFDTISSWLDSIFEELAELAGSIWSVLGEWIDDIINTYLIPLAEDIAELFGLILEWLIPILTGLITIILEFGFQFIYGLLASVGLEGLLDIGAMLFTGFLQFITGLQVFIPDLISVIQTLFYLSSIVGLLLFFGLPLSQEDIGGYITAMIDYMSFDITFGISILGCRIPVPAVALWLVVCIGTVLSGTIFVGFF